MTGLNIICTEFLNELQLVAVEIIVLLSASSLLECEGSAFDFRDEGNTARISTTKRNEGDDNDVKEGQHVKEMTNV